MLHVLASPPVTKNLIFRISNSLLEKKLYKKRTKKTPKKKSCFIFLSGVRYHAEEVCKSSLGTLFDMVYKFYCMVISNGGGTDMTRLEEKRGGCYHHIRRTGVG